MNEDNKTLAVQILRDILPAVGILTQANNQWVFRAQTGVLPEALRAVSTQGFTSKDEAIHALVDQFMTQYAGGVRKVS